MLRSPFLVFLRHRSKDIPTSVGSRSFDILSKTVTQTLTSELGKIPPGFEHRPDSIANLFLEDPSDWWIFMEANGIQDPFEELNIDDVIGLPPE